MLSPLSKVLTCQASQSSLRRLLFLSFTIQTVTWRAWCLTRSHSCHHHRLPSPSTICSNASTSSTNWMTSAPYSQQSVNYSWTWLSDTVLALNLLQSHGGACFLVYKAGWKVQSCRYDRSYHYECMCIAVGNESSLELDTGLALEVAGGKMTRFVQVPFCLGLLSTACYWWHRLCTSVLTPCSQRKLITDKI